MPESVKNASSLVRELSEARVIQAILAVIMTIGVMAMYFMQIPISSELSMIWMFTIGLYIELPSNPRSAAPR